MLRQVTILMVVNAVRAGHSPSSAWCTGDVDTPICNNDAIDRCDSHHGPLDVGATDVYSVSCPANTPVYCSFVQFKVKAGSMSVAVPNAIGLDEQLLPSPGESAEQSRDSCYEIRRYTINHQPVEMGYYFDAVGSPGVINNMEFHLTCDAGPAMSAGPPLPPVCSYQANVQCSCGEPAQPITTMATTTTKTATFPVAPPEHPRPPASSKPLGMSSHEENVIAGIIVAVVFVVIGIFVLWLHRVLKRHKRMTNARLANASPGGKGQPNPLFTAGNDDVALLTVELEEDFAFTGTDDTAVWRVDPTSGRAIPTPPSSTRNTPFPSPSSSPFPSPKAAPFIKRAGRSGPPLHLFRTRTPPPSPGGTPGTGPFDSGTGMRVHAAL